MMGQCGNTQTDPDNCGTCGNKCTAGGNGTPVCNTGVCGLTCGANFADCNHNSADGCEVDLSKDNANCGTCDNKCTSTTMASVSCQAGKCANTMCNAPFMCCAGMPNACETDTSQDVNNCGNCGMKCATVTNGMAACKAGACGIGTCSTGFGDCNKMAGDGCEANLNTDAANWGMCGNACSLANATSSCTTGACAVTTCNTGFADCDAMAANGCEVATATDAMNCGKCGNRCAAGQMCAGGSCVNCFPTGPQQMTKLKAQCTKTKLMEPAVRQVTPPCSSWHSRPPPTYSTIPHRQYPPHGQRRRVVLQRQLLHGLCQYGRRPEPQLV